MANTADLQIFALQLKNDVVLDLAWYICLTQITD